ncbi:MAG: M48 family metalloprotease [Chromatiales bacterium]|nr:M48 family metalloprotease [Chromatiales bacterium]
MSITRRQFTLALAAGTATTALSGCVSTNKATGRTSFTGTMTPKAEVQIGQGEHPKLLKAFGGEYSDRRLMRYVTKVGKQLARSTEYQYPYQFTLLNSPIVNAFALPGGNVYISRGLLALASNEAEMAGVLAHELGHVNARHSAERYGAQQATALGIGGVRLLAGLFLDVAPAMLDAGTQLAQGVAGLALQAYSRKQEFEADTLGVRYMSKAGYDPEAMVTFLATLREQSILDARARGLADGVVDESNMMATHPRTIDRVQAAMTQAHVKRPQTAFVNRDEYFDQIDGMLFGDDPAQGLIQDRRFVHPGLGFQFDVPPGFRLQNSESRVQATNGKGAAVIFDIANLSHGGNMERYITGNWAKGASVQGVERINVNNHRAAVARTRINGKQGQADAQLLAIERDENAVYRLMFISPPGDTARLHEEFRRTTYSFKTLTPAEASQIRPLRVSIQRANNRPVAQLSEALPYGAQNEDWFRVLNDLPNEASPKPNDLIKVIGS